MVKKERENKRVRERDSKRGEININELVCGERKKKDEEVNEAHEGTGAPTSLEYASARGQQCSTGRNIRA